jgi:ribosomal protein L37AE/L43A
MRGVSSTDIVLLVTKIGGTSSLPDGAGSSSYRRERDEVMRRPWTTTITSSPGHLVCPICESGTLEAQAPGLASCAFCERLFSGAVVRVVAQIVALPDAHGNHACEECYHPEMRRLPDGAFHCPACGSEVLPTTT